jgi:MarR family transcriptional regulator, transcriptional regulator for hemolysin
MAEAMGITGATLTHHLNALESRGLGRRWREASNRRVQHMELTADGIALFDRLRHVATRHDQRLRSRLSDTETELLANLLDKLQAVPRHSRNSAPGDDHGNRATPQRRRA